MSPSEPATASRWERWWATAEPVLLKGWDKLLRYSVIALRALWHALVWIGKTCWPAISACEIESYGNAMESKTPFKMLLTASSIPLEAGRECAS